MAHTQILFRDDARAKLLAGASTLADAVRVTLGPKSKSVLIGLGRRDVLSRELRTP